MRYWGNVPRSLTRGNNLHLGNPCPTAKLDVLRKRQPVGKGNENRMKTSAFLPFFRTLRYTTKLKSNWLAKKTPLVQKYRNEVICIMFKILLEHLES